MWRGRTTRKWRWSKVAIWVAGEAFGNGDQAGEGAAEPEVGVGEDQVPDA